MNNFNPVSALAQTKTKKKKASALPYVAVSLLFGVFSPPSFICFIIALAAGILLKDHEERNAHD